MASSETVIGVEINTKALSLGVKEVSGSLGGLKKTVGSLSAELSKAFGWSAVTGYIKEAARSSESLDKELLVLRLGFGKLKAAIGQVIAPLGAVFIPVVQQVVWAITRLVKSVGKVIGALFGGSDASQSFSEDLQVAAETEEKLAKSGTKVKRSLAAFDEIIRLLNSSEGTAAEGSAVLPDTVEDKLSPQLQAIVDKILSLIEPLKKIDFTPAVEAFGRFREALAPIGKELFRGLEWAWHNLLVPLAAWTIEDLLPAFLGLLQGALLVLNEVIIALKPMATWLWENFLQPIAQWAGGMIVESLQWMTEKLENFSGWISRNQGLVQALVTLVGGLGAAILLTNGGLSEWNILGGAATPLTAGLGNAISGLVSPVGLVRTAILVLIGAVTALVTVWDEVKIKAQQVWQSIQTVWGNIGNWFRTQIYLPLQNGFRNMVNGIIGFINGMLAGAVKGINALVNGLNSLKINIPSWVPGLGGKSFGFQYETVTAPQIPYLAQGAVLPANRPFMAVLGDQRHGTNIEAPLETIKQALAEVLSMQNNGASAETVVNVNFTGELAQLARILKPAIDTESRRKGVSLISGGV